MPRQSGISVMNKFVKGLITEATALSFPEDACTETDNVVFDPTGRITRRLGFDTEASYTTDTVTVDNTSVYTEFLWTAVAGDGNVSFLVVQHDTAISFYNVSTTAEVSGNQHATELDLTDYLASESDQDPGIHECQYAAGNGDLFIVNSSCDPIYVTYDPTTDEFTATIIVLSQRDFEGLDDGLAIDERPTDTVSGTTNPNHLYNLFNQGWGLTDALTQWDTARADLPSNADYFELYRASTTDAFNPSSIDAQDPGNRPAPNGHFILEVSKQNRQEVFEAEGNTAVTTSDSFSQIPATTGTIFTDFNLRASAAFDDDISQADSVGATFTGAVANGYMGRDYGVGNEKTIARMKIWGSNNNGFVSAANPSITITLYGNNSTPANGTDGTILGTTTFTDDTFNQSHTIDSSDVSTAWRYVWAYIDPAGSATIRVGEVKFYTSSISFERPSCTEFYAGRSFFGGISTPALSNNIYFSQIIEGKDQYGKCYQKNDPTTSIGDLLPDDGGVIKIPDMGTLKKLYSYQSALLVFASNGVWLISGSSGSNFKATDYVVKKISSIGMNAPLSLVSLRGLPAWWGEDGIYTVQFDANYDSFTPKSLTLVTIDRFYQSIPLGNKRYVKGTYDEDAQVAYWLYNSDSSLSTDFYKYDSVLCLDGKSQAFYTWTISDGPLVRGVSFIKPATRSTVGKVKYLLHRNYNGSSAGQTFGEVLNTSYIDWDSEGTDVDYTSYFITGYKLDGQTQKFFQPNYVFVFLETETNSSAYIQSIFDFTTDSSTGKWSSSQQIYNNSLLNRSVNFRRLKCRGKGRALQLKFNSDTGKPFNIIGWSIMESTNSGI